MINNKQLKEGLEALYEELWTFPPEQKLQMLDRLQSKRKPDDLYETAGSPFIDESYHILDLGCGLGKHTFNLAKRFRCHVTGVDLCEGNLKIARQILQHENDQNLVDFVNADIQETPLCSSAFDVIWCRDVLIHVPNLAAALNECNRMLRPHGTVIIYTTFATELFSKEDLELTVTPLNLIEKNLNSDFFENQLKEVGLIIAQKVILGGEWIEYNEDQNGMGSQYLRRLMRMVRNRDYFREKLGCNTFDTYLALYYWQLFFLLGKLSGTVYRLEKKAITGTNHDRI